MLIKGSGGEKEFEEFKELQEFKEREPGVRIQESGGANQHTRDVGDPPCLKVISNR
jgi:hypothetical protein